MSQSLCSGTKQPLRNRAVQHRRNNGPWTPEKTTRVNILKPSSRLLLVTEKTQNSSPETRKSGLPPAVQSAAPQPGRPPHTHTPTL